MATHSPAKTGGTYTLTASVVDTVTMPATGVAFLQVLNHDTVWVYFTIDGSTPTVAGEGVFALGPGAAETFDALPGAVLKIISNAASVYSVNF